MNDNKLITNAVAKVRRLRNQCYFYELEGADILRQYTDEELARIYNGIGPASFPAPLREAIDNLTPDLQCVALIHDTEYSTGEYPDINSAESRAAFEAANDRFRRNGKRIASAKYCPLIHPLKYFGLRAAACSFAALCDRYGWDAWVEGHAKTAVNNQQTKGQTP